MIDARKNIPKLNVLGVSAKKGKPLSNVYLELWKENFQTPEEGLTNDKGTF